MNKKTVKDVDVKGKEYSFVATSMCRRTKTVRLPTRTE